ncbi:hypothetical protein [Vibrio cholerae]|uniref:hypothetical protein n=1 Tax=Vibrio cholerae TaxID=666 RepID=UPI001195B323|nr:hypothetical protein FPV63_08630 [Vibrio cholerae]
MTNQIIIFFFVSFFSGFFCLFPMFFYVPQDKETVVLTVQILSLICLALSGINAKNDLVKVFMEVLK